MNKKVTPDLRSGILDIHSDDEKADLMPAAD